MAVSDPRFEVENDEVKALLRDISRIIKSQMPDGWGFTLLLFSYGAGGDLFYMSSAQRDDMIKLMREFIAKQGKQ
jgi:hypothetical protein